MTDTPDPATLRTAVRELLAQRQDSAAFVRRQRNAQATLAAHPKLKRWRHVGVPQPQRGEQQ